jgi:hypothetical protein
VAAQQHQAAMQQQQLEQAVADAQAGHCEAERRLRDSERQMSDMRSALDSQERLLVVLREQVAQGGAAASRAGELEGAVQVGSLSQHSARQRGSAMAQASTTLACLVCVVHNQSLRVVVLWI